MVYYFDDINILIVLFVTFVLSVIVLKLLKKSNMYLIFFLVMFVYLCKLIDLTQFPIYASEGMKAVMGGQNVWKEMNLIPFKTIIENFSKDDFFNIIMTIPLGFGFPFLIKHSWKKALIIGIIVGILSEAGQLATAIWIGFTFRHVNVDDTILNLFGTLIGYILFKLFCCMFYWSYRKMDITENAFLSYILNIRNEK